MQDDLYFSMKLMELSRSFKDQMGKLDHDIPFALRQICLYVQQHPGCCQEDIASELMMDKSLLGRNVRKAQQMGLLERKVSPVDNRRVELYLCDKQNQVVHLVQQLPLSKVCEYHRLLHNWF